MTKYFKSQVDHSTPSHNLPNQEINHRYIVEKTRNEKKFTENNQRGDDLQLPINSLNEIDLIKSIVRKKDSYFFFLASNRQINDIVKFRCVDNNCSVLGIDDTTYNLCNVWVTDSCY